MVAVGQRVGVAWRLLGRMEAGNLRSAILLRVVAYVGSDACLHHEVVNTFRPFLILL